MSDLQADSHFYELNELATMPLSDLQALWDSVPIEQQAYLARVFEREAAKRQIVEDADEAHMAQQFLGQYQQSAFVPAGDVWLKVPASVQEMYKRPLSVALDDGSDAPQSDETPSTTVAGLPRWVLLLAVPFACMMIFAGMRLLMGGGDESAETDVAQLATPTRTPSPTPTPTITPTPPPATPTPFALSGFDAAITAGERIDRDYYPVQLQIFPNRDTSPRVFIVQQHEIGVAEWRFDRNPDIVSWLGGMLVRPVLGVPFNEANLDLFLALNPDSVFVVTMNTGNVLQFVFEDITQVTRADTGHFRQDMPGLVLVLIGETFEDGAPTDLRYLVTASYPSEQEIARLTADAPQVVAMQTAHSFDDFSAQVVQTGWHVAPELPPEVGIIWADVQLTTGDADLLTDSLNPRLSLVSAPDERFAPDPNAASHGNCAPMPAFLPANTVTCASLGFIAPRSSVQAQLSLRDVAFALDLTPAETLPTLNDLDIQLGQITHTADTLSVMARLFNPTETTMTVTPDAFGLVLGFIPNPTGMTHHPSFVPTDIAPNTAIDFTVDFPYGGEGYATLTMLGRVWSVEIQ